MFRLNFERSEKELIDAASLETIITIYDGAFNLKPPLPTPSAVFNEKHDRQKTLSRMLFPLTRNVDNNNNNNNTKNSHNYHIINSNGPYHINIKNKSNDNSKFNNNRKSYCNSIYNLKITSMHNNTYNS